MVTGAAGGIGRALCLELAQRGYSLVACDCSDEELELLAAELEHQGARCDRRAFDLRDARACELAMRWVGETAGRLDALVNNAGAWFHEPFLESTDEHWREVVEVNVLAPARLARLAVPLLAQSPQPRIVNVASINAFLGAWGWSSYDVSKAALVALTRSLALELAELGILVNAVAPGFIATESNRSVLEDPEASEFYRRRIPLGRFGHPREIARAVAFLCSEDCGFATGSTLLMDGGHLAGEKVQA